MTEKYDPQRAPTPRRSIAGGPKPPVYRRICQIADLPPDALQDPETNLITLLKLLLDKGRTVPKSICLVLFSISLVWPFQLKTTIPITKFAPKQLPLSSPSLLIFRHYEIHIHRIAQFMWPMIVFWQFLARNHDTTNLRLSRNINVASLGVGDMCKLLLIPPTKVSISDTKY